MEKRVFTRQLLEHDAQFSNQFHQPEACKIKDFCKGGLFIAYSLRETDPLNRQARKYRPGDTVTVSFRSARPLQLKYQLETKVARLMDGAMGLAVTQYNPEAIHALYSLANKQAQKPKPPAQHISSEYQQVADKCRVLIEGFLNAGSKRIFDKIKIRLTEKAGKAINNAKETEYFDTIAKFTKYQAKIATAFSTLALAQVDNWMTGKDVTIAEPTNDSLDAKLSLIEKDDFEDWLIVKVIAAKAEQSNKEALFNLQIRMSEVSAHPVNNKNNPISPTHLCHAFFQAVHPLALKKEIAEQVFETFNEHFVSHFESFYEKLNTLFADNGIKPEITFHASKSKSLPDEKVRDPAPAEPLSNSDKSTKLKSQNGTAVQTGANPPPAAAASQASASGPEKPIAPTPSSEAAAGDHATPIDHFHSQQGIAKQAFETVQNLLQLQTQVKEIKRASILEDYDHSTFIPKTNYEPEFVINNLTKLQTTGIDLEELGTTTPLHERLSNYLGDDSRQLSEEDTNKINVTDNFFKSMLANQTLTQDMKPTIKQLEIPLLKILLKDDSFFEDNGHPARRALNLLAKLGSKGNQLNKAFEENIDHILERITKEFDQDTKVFDEVLPTLEELVNKQEEIAQRNTARVIESCEGLQTIEKAKAQVIQFIDNQIGGKWAPKVLIDLLDQGWRELLVFSILRDGKNSAIWKSYARVVEKLAQFSPDPKQNNDLLKQGAGIVKMIETGINDAPTRQTQLRKLLPSLNHLLKPDNSSPEPTFVEVSKDAQTPDVAFAAIDDSNIQDKALLRWIKRAKRLKVGDWIEFGEDESLLQIRLAWVDDHHKTFVFVNHQGMKVLEFKLKEVAEHMQSGNARVLKNPDEPFVDQSLDQMVQNMYEQMNFQATHNDISGLINRKEFERLLTKVLQETKTGQQGQVALQLNLDQFKVINNACGHEGGNLLIKEIAEILQQRIEDGNLLAHLGGDEFAVILSNSDTKSAKKTAHLLMEGIQEHRFIWEQKTYTVGVSVGIVEIHEGMSIAAQVISALDSACLSAKEAGRNRVYIYQLNDEDNSKRMEVIDKMAILNKALDEKRLQLRCQKIAPIHTIIPVKPHYEILLTVQDEEGTHLAPGDFIIAAERYNRMQDVDRWVIHTIFHWLAENQDKLDEIEGLTINLSGHSLNDESLIAFIFEELVDIDIPREKICFEVTETTAVLNLEDAADFMTEMKSLGFKFALDDFGTGLSSYKYLKSLPVDYLKIDGSFVINLDSDLNDYAMVKSINDMAHLMGKKTVAEYVENDMILDRLREIGVDYAQGFGIEKPLLLNNIFKDAA